MPEFRINNEDIAEGAKSVDSSIKPLLHPAFANTYNKNAPIKNWTSNSYLGVYTNLIPTDSKKYKNFPLLYEDAAKGNLRINNEVKPVMINGNVFNWSDQVGFADPDYTFTIKARRKTLTSNTYIVSIYSNDTFIFEVNTKNIGIQMVGGGAAGGSGPATGFVFGMTAYNGGGGGGGAGIMLHLHIKNFPDTNERIIMRCRPGRGGKISEGENVIIWNKHPIWGGTYYAPGSNPSAATQSWVEVYMDNQTSTYHFDAGGAQTRSLGDDASSKAGGSPSVWKSAYNSQDKIKDISVGTKIEDSNFILTYIAGTKGGNGGARVNKGSGSWMSAKDKDIPSIYWQSPSKKDDADITWGYDPADGSADMPDPFGPGWGGCSIFARGDYVQNQNGSVWIYGGSARYAPGAGGLGAMLEYIRPVIGGNVTMRSGTNGHDGEIRFYYG